MEGPLGALFDSRALLTRGEACHFARHSTASSVLARLRLASTSPTKSPGCSRGTSSSTSGTPWSTGNAVAEQSGFQSPVSFRQSFKRALHVSPSEWRKTFGS